MTDYRILGAGTDRPLVYGRETGEEFIVIRLQVGKRSTIETIRLTDEQALAIAQGLIDATRRSLKRAREAIEGAVPQP